MDKPAQSATGAAAALNRPHAGRPMKAVAGDCTRGQAHEHAALGSPQMIRGRPAKALHEAARARIPGYFSGFCAITDLRFHLATMLRNSCITAWSINDKVANHESTVSRAPKTPNAM